MRLKRSDLAKEFETIVQQEIINHNKQIESTNGMLQKIQGSLDCLSMDCASHIARLESQLWNIRDKLKEINTENDQLKRVFENNSKSLSDEMDYINFEINRRMDYLEDNTCDQDTFLEKIDEVHEAINCFEKMIETQKFYIHSEIYNMNKECKRWFEEFTHKIESTPSEIPKLQEYLELKIADAVVDAKGVLREFEILKKENFVTQKKIENLYTLIDRLQDERG